MLKLTPKANICKDQVVTQINEIMPAEMASHLGVILEPTFLIYFTKTTEF